MNIKIKKLHPQAIIPKYQTTGSACFDLHIIEPITIHRFEVVKCPIGLAFEVPHGYVMNLHIRSGMAFNHKLSLINDVGVTDSDFRGGVVLGLFSNNDMPVTLEAGTRVAQAMIVPVKQVDFSVVDELNETERGQGGFGSTGS